MEGQADGPYHAYLAVSVEMGVDLPTCFAIEQANLHIDAKYLF